MCPQMSPFVLICPITRYFTAFLIPVTLQPKGIGQANQAPDAGSVPISANSNPSVGGFLFALANSKVCWLKYKIGFLPVEYQDFKKGKSTMGNDLETSERLRSAFFFHCFK